MNNLDAILEVAIGLVLTWLILSVATVEVQDIITKWLGRRAKFLEQSILEMFQYDQSYVELFYDQPVIQALYPRNRKGEIKKNIFGQEIKPGYIPNDAFAEAALEMFINLGTEQDQLGQATASIERCLQEVDKLKDQNKKLWYFVQRILPDFDGKESIEKINKTHKKAVEFKVNAENWFDASMQRASYFYKVNAKNWAFFIGFALAAIFNVDSLQITNQLWREPTLRQSLIAQAQVVDENTGPDSVAKLEEYYTDLKLPVGWEVGQAGSISLQGWLTKIFGFLISGLAAMQGAPFWFEFLKKLLKFKGGSKAESESPPPPSAPPPASTEIEAVG